MKVLIGLPIYDRAWILPEWFAAIERQDYPLEKIGFLFLMAPHDPDTVNELMAWSERHPEVTSFDMVTVPNLDHDTHPEGARIWTYNKYRKMVTLRNRLLDQVTAMAPDRFFSLDSDILLEDPTTLRYLLQLSVKHPAVTPLLYMTPVGVGFPSTMTWSEGFPGSRCGRAPDYPIGKVFQTDVIMAAKMMTPEVYTNIRYEYHDQGEDIGWSANCARAGIPLYLASNIYCPHIMSRAHLKQYRAIGDPRKAVIYGRYDGSADGHPMRLNPLPD